MRCISISMMPGGGRFFFLIIKLKARPLRRFKVLNKSVLVCFFFHGLYMCVYFVEAGTSTCSLPFLSVPGACLSAHSGSTLRRLQVLKSCFL